MTAVTPTAAPATDSSASPTPPAADAAVPPPPSGPGAPPLFTSPPRSVLVIRLSARGDILFTSPMVRAIRRTWPDARIVWLGESHTVDLIRYHPELDRVIVWDRVGWKRLLRRGRLLQVAREALALVGALRRERFDLVLDLQGVSRSGILAWLSGAPHRVGLGSREGSRLLMTRVLPRDRSRLREIAEEYRVMAEALGLDTREFRLEAPLPPHAREWARERVRALGLEDGYLAVVPFTTRPQKHWFEERWSELARRAAEELGLRTVVLGGPDDREAMERIRAGFRGDPAQLVDLVGTTTLDQAAAILEGAALVVGVDTGLNHVGIAFDRPTVSLFGSNVPFTQPPNPRTRILLHRLPCVPCKGNPTCNGDFTCMRLITVDEVLEAAREVMAVPEVPPPTASGTSAAQGGRPLPPTPPR